MIHPRHLRLMVVRPVLEILGLHSAAAEELLMGTIAQESVIAGLQCLRQVGGGPALGICQVEPATHEDCWANYLRHRDDDDPETNLVGDRVKDLVSPAAWSLGREVLSGDGRREGVPADWLLASDMRYCVAIARIKYRRVPAPLPAADDLDGLGRYWDEYYNANPEHGFPPDWVAAYRRMREAEVAPA